MATEQKTRKRKERGRSDEKPSKRQKVDNDDTKEAATAEILPPLVLADGLNDYRKNFAFTDIAIECSDGVVLYFYRLILRDASSVLESVIRNADRELKMSYPSGAVNAVLNNLRTSKGNNQGYINFNDRDLLYVIRIYDGYDMMRCVDFSFLSDRKEIGVSVIEALNRARYDLSGIARKWYEGELQITGGALPQCIALLSRKFDVGSNLPRVLTEVVPLLDSSEESDKYTDKIAYAIKSMIRCYTRHDATYVAVIEFLTHVKIEGRYLQVFDGVCKAMSTCPYTAYFKIESDTKSKYTTIASLSSIRSTTIIYTPDVPRIIELLAAAEYTQDVPAAIDTLAPLLLRSYKKDTANLLCLVQNKNESLLELLRTLVIISIRSAEH